MENKIKQEKFLVSVADILVRDKVTKEVVLTGKTLTDSSISVSVTNDILRGGKGNLPLYVYNHDKNMEGTITDAAFDLAYMALNNGATIVQGGEFFGKETVNVTAGVGTVLHTPLTPYSNTPYGYVSYGNVANEKVEFTGNTFTISDTTYNGDVCISYFRDELNARSVTISAAVNLDAYEILYDMTIGVKTTGVDGSESTSQFGTLQMLIPNAQPTGNWELSLTSDGTASSQLNFIALATDTATVGCSNTAGKLATIVENISGTNWYDNVNDLVVSLNGSDNVSVAVGESISLTVRAVTTDGAIININTVDRLGQLTVATSDENKATVTGNVITGVASGEAAITYTVTGKPSVNTTINVTVE